MGTRDEAATVLPKMTETDAAKLAGEMIERHRSTAKQAPEFLHGKPYVILRHADGSEHIEYVTGQMERPTFRKGTVALADAPSFISYFNTHKNPTSAIYASLSPLGFTAILDEHPGAQGPSPSWREFRATFVPTLSREWITWMGRNGNGPNKGFDSTEEFAYFIEDNAPDFDEPDAATMMEIALNFKVSQSANYKAVQRLQDGKIDLQYVNDVTASAGAGAGGGSIRIPEEFRISIPIFQGLSVPPVQISARFRFRLSHGQLRLWYELVRPQRVLEEGFKNIVTEVHDGTDVQILLGTSD